jgi:hypothetical protein
MIIIESTANGMGNYFHKLWVDAIDGKNDFNALFFPWFEHAEYVMLPPSGDFELLNNATYGDEQLVRDTYNLTNSQLMWRRWCIKNNCGGDLKQFNQEYPACWQEAFIASGNPRFNTDALQYYQAQRLLKDIIFTGDIVAGDKVVPRENGELKIYHKPDQRSQYLIVADVSEGLTVGDKVDPSVAKVFDRRTWQMVAEWHGQIEHGDFGSILGRLGRVYNHAVIVVEANNHGHSTLTQLRKIEAYPDELIFEHDILAKERPDQDFNIIDRRYGWRTTPQTRPIIISNLAQMLLDRHIIELTQQDINELYSFVVLKGKAQASVGCHDDRVIVLCIAYYLMSNDTFNAYYPVMEPEYWQMCNTCSYCKAPTVIKDGGRCEKSMRIVKGEWICSMWDEYDYSDDD